MVRRPPSSLIGYIAAVRKFSSLSLATSLGSALTAGLLILGSVHAAVAQSVSFQGLGFLPGGNSTVATGVSADGTVVVGNSNPGSGSQQGFSWKNSVITGLGFPGGGSTSAADGVNSNGSVIVGIGNDAGAGAAVIWTNGTATLLPQTSNCCGGPPPPPCAAEALGVDADATGPSSSVVVGQNGTAGCGPGAAVAWLNGAEDFLFTSGSGLAQGVNSDGSVIVGEVGVDASESCNPCTQAFRWTSGGATTLGDFGGNFSAAYATNSDGSVVVGTAAVNNTVSHAFRWTAATGLVALGNAAIDAEALAVSGNGDVIVGQAGNNGPAFRWTATDGMQNLQILLRANGVDITASNWTNLVQATGVSADGGTIVGWGGGPDTTTEAFIATLPVNARILAHAHDFNADSYSDILWRSTSGGAALWLMNGAAVLQSGGFGAAPSTWSIVGQRDFNGDGNADILWRDTSGNTSIWLMNGLAVTSAVGLGNVPTNWSIDGTGDLNGDGKGDLLWRDSAGDVAVWFLNGGTVSSTASFGNVATTWTIVGDDTKGNIFWHDSAGNYAVWHSSGGQVTGSVGLGNVPLASWQIAGLGDFNGDGSTDILWRDTAGDLAIWFLNSSLGVQSTASLGNVPTTWTMAQTGDYNGDGMSDILWQDSAGDVAIWFLDGGTVSSSAGLGNVGTTWTAQSLNAE